MEVGADDAWPLGALAPTDDDERNGHTVAQLLPAGFPRYLRIFRPFLPADPMDPDGTLPGPVRRWASLAHEAGLSFHPEIQWRTLERRGVLGDGRPTRPFWLSDRLDGPGWSALCRLLAKATVSERLFAYFGLGLVIARGDPALYRIPVASLPSIHGLVEADLGVRQVPGPEYIWPDDRSWLVNKDYDLDSTYIGCGDRLAEAILAESMLEALPVTLRMRVDRLADTINDGECEVR
jgi:hypothetical protein